MMPETVRRESRRITAAACFSRTSHRPNSAWRLRSMPHMHSPVDYTSTLRTIAALAIATTRPTSPTLPQEEGTASFCRSESRARPVPKGKSSCPATIPPRRLNTMSDWRAPLPRPASALPTPAHLRANSDRSSIASVKDPDPGSRVPETRNGDPDVRSSK